MPARELESVEALSPCWPSTEQALVRAQLEIAARHPPAWDLPDRAVRSGGCFVCFDRGGTGPGSPGSPGDRGWAGAVVVGGGQLHRSAVARGHASAAYRAGYLALREGSLLEAAIRALSIRPEVLLVNATGRDHPRGCGLAVHLGACLEIPTAGVTHRPLLATGAWPASKQGSTSPLRLGDRLVGYWLRTSPDARPLAVHAGWRTSPEAALRIVQAVAGRFRTPTPLREARRLAREARASGCPSA